MIVRKNLKLSKILAVSWKALLAYAVIASSVFILHQEAGITFFKIPFAIVGTLGTALAIILAFRNNASYDRWWEARKIWGGIVNYSRTFGRQVTTLVSTQFMDGKKGNTEIKIVQKELIYRHIAWMNALRLQLRKQEEWQDIAPFLKANEFQWIKHRKNKATQLVQVQGEKLQELRKEGLIEDFRHMQLDNTLTELYNLQGKAERIKNTPLARQYDFFPKIFMALFIFLFPFGLIDILSQQHAAWLVIPLTVSVGYVFYVIRKIGEFNEDPFENRVTDTPMSNLCRTIEIDLREMLKESNLPPKLEPVDGFLF